MGAQQLPLSHFRTKPQAFEASRPANLLIPNYTVHTEAAASRRETTVYHLAGANASQWHSYAIYSQASPYLILTTYQSKTVGAWLRMAASGQPKATLYFCPDCSNIKEGRDPNTFGSQM